MTLPQLGNVPLDVGYDSSFNPVHAPNVYLLYKLTCHYYAKSLSRTFS